VLVVKVLKLLTRGSNNAERVCFFLLSTAISEERPVLRWIKELCPNKTKESLGRRQEQPATNVHKFLSFLSGAKIGEALSHTTFDMPSFSK